MGEDRRKQVDRARQKRLRERDAERGVKQLGIRVPIEFHDAFKKLSAALRDDFPLHDALADVFGASEASEREIANLKAKLADSQESERSAQNQIVGVTLDADDLRKELKETAKDLGECSAEYRACQESAEKCATDKAAIEQELGEARKRVDELEAELDASKGEVFELGHKVGFLQKRVDEFTTWRADLDRRGLWDRILRRW